MPKVYACFAGIFGGGYFACRYILVATSGTATIVDQWRDSPLLPCIRGLTGIVGERKECTTTKKTSNLHP